MKFSMRGARSLSSTPFLRRGFAFRAVVRWSLPGAVVLLGLGCSDPSPDSGGSKSAQRLEVSERVPERKGDGRAVSVERGERLRELRSTLNVGQSYSEVLALLGQPDLESVEYRFYVAPASVVEGQAGSLLMISVAGGELRGALVGRRNAQGALEFSRQLTAGPSPAERMWIKKWCSEGAGYRERFLCSVAYEIGTNSFTVEDLDELLLCADRVDTECLYKLGTYSLVSEEHLLVSFRDGEFVGSALVRM